MKTAMNAGLHGGLFEWKHIVAMNSGPMGLFGWLVLRQTRTNGLVLGGKILTYEGILIDMKAPKPKGKLRTIKRWMSTLVSKQYVAIKRMPNHGIIVQILNPKKHGSRQGDLFQKPKNESDTSDTLAKSEKAIPDTLSIPKVSLSDTKGVTLITSGDKLSHNKSETCQLTKAREPVVLSHILTTPEQERALPDGIAGLVPLPLWRDFVAVRTTKNKPTTAAAILILTRKLLEFQAAGDDPITVVEQSVVNCWADIFPLKKENGANGHTRKSKEQERNERSAAALANVFGGHRDMSRSVRGDVPGGNHNTTSHRLPGGTEGFREPEITPRGLHARDAVIDVSPDGGGDSPRIPNRIRERAKAETA